MPSDQKSQKEPSLATLFDVAGYDPYIPDPGKVADAALISREDDEYSLMCTDEGEPVRSRAIQASADSFTLSSTNGKDWKSLQLTADLYRDFRQAYQKNLEQFSYSFARASRPVARVSLDYHGASGRKALYPNLAGCTFSCPVYASFTNTIRFLQESGVWTEPYVYDSLPRLSDYESLSAEDRDLLDTLDLTVFTGPFHHSH